MFWVINVTEDCPSSFKAEIYSSDKFTEEQVFAIFNNYCNEVDEDGELITEINEFDYTLDTFDGMEEVEEFTEGYHYIMGDN